MGAKNSAGNGAYSSRYRRDSGDYLLSRLIFDITANMSRVIRIIIDADIYSYLPWGEEIAPEHFSPAGCSDHYISTAANSRQILRIAVRNSNSGILR